MNNKVPALRVSNLEDALISLRREQHVLCQACRENTGAVESAWESAPADWDIFQKGELNWAKRIKGLPGGREGGRTQSMRPACTEASREGQFSIRKILMYCSSPFPSFSQSRTPNCTVIRKLA